MGNSHHSKHPPTFPTGQPAHPQSAKPFSKQSETAVVSPFTEPFPFSDQHFLIEICAHAP